VFDRINGRWPASPEELVDREIIVAFEKLKGGPDVIRDRLLVGRPHGNRHGCHACH
jgi:hypothetical protein